MAKEYAKVLKSLKRNFLVIGRGEESASAFQKTTGIPPIRGGIEKWLKSNTDKLPAIAIVAVDVDKLGYVARLIIKHGIKLILLEKPGGMNLNDLSKTKKIALRNGAKIFIAYNRRFYSSTEKAREFIK